MNGTERNTEIVDDCPDGYPHCAGCGYVFETDDELYEHACSDHGNISMTEQTEKEIIDQYAYDVGFEEAVADIITIKTLLVDDRPLEALRVADEAVERHKPNLPDRSIDRGSDQ